MLISALVGEGLIKFWVEVFPVSGIKVVSVLVVLLGLHLDRCSGFRGWGRVAWRKGVMSLSESASMEVIQGNSIFINEWLWKVTYWLMPLWVLWRMSGGLAECFFLCCELLPEG
jgi:hypothetical protein